MTSAIVAGRALAESAMTLTLTAYAPGGTTTDADGYKVPAFTSQGTTPGKVQGDSGPDFEARYMRVGDAERPVVRGGLHIPISAFVDDEDGLLIETGEQRGLGWEFTVTAVGPNDDPALLNRRYLVVGVPVKSFATARRLDVVEL